MHTEKNSGFSLGDPNSLVVASGWGGESSAQWEPGPEIVGALDGTAMPVDVRAVVRFLAVFPRDPACCNE